MNFAQLKALFEKGAGLLSDGRNALTQVRDAISDGTAAISTSEKDELAAMLDNEERETMTSIASARDAIAEYRAGG